MSEQVELPDPTEAYNHLSDSVHSQVFFGKLAEYGIQPVSEKEVEDLFKLAGSLRSVTVDTQKQAESRFTDSVNALNQHINEDPYVRAQSVEFATKKAAANLMQDPTIYNAVLSLKANEAAVLAAQ